MMRCNIHDKTINMTEISSDAILYSSLKECIKQSVEYLIKVANDAGKGWDTQESVSDSDAKLVVKSLRYLCLLIKKWILTIDIVMSYTSMYLHIIITKIKQHNNF